MKYLTEREFEDQEGKKTEKFLEGGLIETALVEPSQWYIDNVLMPMQEQAQKRKKEMKKSQKIAEKLREMAEKELEKEDG